MMAEKHNPGSFGLIPKLIQDYLKNDEVVLKWTEGSQSDPAWEKRMRERAFSQEKRNALRDHCLKQYGHWGMLSPSRKQQIDQLLHEDTFTVTTGHQLNLFSGPAFFVYKVLHTILLAEHISKESGKKVLPIYWMATEDHDWEEINYTWWFNVKVEWDNIQKGGALGKVGLDGTQEALQKLKDELRLESLPFEKLLTESVKLKDSLSDFTAKLVHLIFPDAPILVLDSDDKALKSAFAGVMKKELQEAFSQKAVETQSDELTAAGYHAQIHAREINLFWLSDENRTRIVKTSSGFSTLDEESQWSEFQLLKLLSESPEFFSPNVVLRPVYQECILPNLAYIGGPAEISYWMQLKQVFAQVGVPFPQLIMRNQALILHVKDAERMEQLGVELKDLFDREEDLLSRWNRAQVDTDFSQAEKHLQEMMSALQSQIPANDGLKNMLSAQEAKWKKDFAQLENRIAKANKSKHEQSLRQLKKLRDKVYPNGTFQERNQNFFSFLNMYPGILEQLEANFHPMGAQFLVLYMD